MKFEELKKEVTKQVKNGKAIHGLAMALAMDTALEELEKENKKNEKI